MAMRVNVPVLPVQGSKMNQNTRMSDTEVCVNPNQMQDFELIILCRHQTQVMLNKPTHLPTLDLLQRH